MRVVFDTNILISYLLQPTGDGPPARIVRVAFAGAVTPMVSPKLMRELHRKVANKPYLTQRIPAHRMNSFVQRFTGLAELHDDAKILYPGIIRDRKDDYLITNAVVNQADYLVSGDHDLLELGEFEGVRIVSPAEFAAILDTEG